MKIIGLTGGIATGKSSVADYLIKQNIPVLNADKISAILLNKNKSSVLKIFGKSVLKNNKLDKNYIKNQIFNNKIRKNQLEKLLHPKIRQFIKNKIKKLTVNCVVVEVPLLFESGWQDDFNEIWLITSDYQKSRLLARDNISEELANKIIQSQKSRFLISDLEWEQLPVKILQNNGKLSELLKQIEQLIHPYFKDL